VQGELALSTGEICKGFQGRLCAVTNQPEPKRTALGKGGRRVHSYFQVILTYPDGDEFSRIYTNEEKAKGFAKRQKRSPLVKSVRVIKL
jgi:hypothetical protein